MSRMAAPVVAPNRSTTSWARVGCAEREMAPLSWTISVAAVQPGRRCAGQLEHRAAPRDADGAAGPEGGEVGGGRCRHALAGQQLVVRRRTRSPARPRRRRRAARSARVERVLELDEAGGRVDDLDPDGDLAQGPVQQPADLEAADAEPLADLVLGQVQPVVELGGTEHEPGLARERLALARGRRARACSNVQRSAHVLRRVPPRRGVSVEVVDSSGRRRTNRRQEFRHVRFRAARRAPGSPTMELVRDGRRVRRSRARGRGRVARHAGPQRRPPRFQRDRPPRVDAGAGAVPGRAPARPVDRVRQHDLARARQERRRDRDEPVARPTVSMSGCG